MNRSLVKLALGCAALALGVVAQADTTSRPPGKAFPAYSGSFTNGGQDKDMLRRIAVGVADYLKANFDNAIGGRTGRDE
jgi:hypothetical protein